MKLSVFTGEPKFNVSGYNDNRNDIYAEVEKLFVGGSTGGSYGSGSTYSPTTTISKPTKEEDNTTLYAIIIVIVLMIIAAAIYFLK